MKHFNTEGPCIPSLHYMVDLSGRLAQIRKMIDEGKYFTINRARQYGKTTTLRALAQSLRDTYLVVSLDFQQLSAGKFRDEGTFSRAFASRFLRALREDANVCRMKEEDPERSASPEPTEGALLPDDCFHKDCLDRMNLQKALQRMEQEASDYSQTFELMELFDRIADICAASPVKLVMIIDEVDSASNNQVFLDFLAQIRSDYLERMDTPTFQSVILAGVYDVRNLRRRIRPEDAHKVNSPWNIAADFDVDMSFHPDDIEGMLDEYAADHGFSFDRKETAGLIYDYTGGYPFLVSRICQIIDERLLGKKPFTAGEKAWSVQGVDTAAGILEREKNTLFESLAARLTNSGELRDMVSRILFNGAEIPYVALDPHIEQAAMFGFIREQDGKVAIANRIFETVLYNLLLTSERDQKTEIWKAGEYGKPAFAQDGHLNMDLVLSHFVTSFDDLYGDRGTKFAEEDGRRYFLLYLKPIINGTGNYYIESRTRNNERTDVIVDYLGEQFVIELKIWRGNSYNERGERQLAAYLDHYHLKKGWMLSFCFNKDKKVGLHTIYLNDKILVEAVC